MNAAWHIAVTDLRRRYFAITPWLVLAAAQGLLAWLLFIQLETYQKIQPQLTAQAGNLGVTDLVVAPTLSSAALVLLIAVPLLGMGSLAGERRDNGLALYLSSPVGIGSLVLGKWLGLVVAALPLLVAPGLMAASLVLGTDLDLGRLLAGLIGLLGVLLLAAAVTVTASAHTRQPAAAGGVAMLLLVMLWLLGDDRGALSALALGPHLQTALRGWLAPADLGWSVALTAAALALAWHRLWTLTREARVDGRSRLRNGTFQLLLAISTGLSLSLLDGWSDTGPAWDLTRNSRNQLSEQSIALLEQLDGPLSITAVAPDLPIPRARIEQFFARYQRHHPELLIAYLDPNRQPDQAGRLGLHGNLGMLVEHAGRSERVEGFSETALGTALLRLARSESPWLVYAAGADAATPDGTGARRLAALDAHLAGRGYHRFTLDLAAIGQVPDNADLLVLAGPDQVLSAVAAGAVSRFIGRGGNLLWLVEGEQPELQSVLGLDLLPGRLVDAAAAEYGLADPRIIRATAVGRHPLTRGLREAVQLPWATALKISALQTRDSGWSAASLLQSGPRSWNETSEISGRIAMNSEAGEQRGPLPVGVALERKAGGQSQRAVVIGDADFVADAHLGRGANLEFALNLVDWLASAEAFKPLPPRLAPDREFTASPALAAGLGALWMLALPLLLVAAGVLIRRRRQRR